MTRQEYADYIARGFELLEEYIKQVCEPDGEIVFDYDDTVSYMKDGKKFSADLYDDVCFNTLDDCIDSVEFSQTYSITDYFPEGYEPTDEELKEFYQKFIEGTL